jgi:putative transposase
VGGQVRADMPEALVTNALQSLLAQRPACGLIVYADQGVQHVGNGYKTLLRD